MTIEFGALSDTGPVRSDNEDFIGNSCPDESASEVAGEPSRAGKSCLFAIADGVGGSLAGEVAAREAVETLLRFYAENSNPARPDRTLKDGFEAANLRVYDQGQLPQFRRMKTTLAALLLQGDDAHIGHIGDTRVYLLRGQETRQLTRDHSEVGELQRLGIISPDEARHHPRRNIITRSLGSELMLQADFRVEKVLDGDVFVLCSDGLWEPVEDADMARIVAGNSPQNACAELVRLAIERGTSDNLSVQVVRVVSVGEATPSQPKRGLMGRLFGR